MGTEPTPDKLSRRLAQSEFDHPVVVEAGAGTGKTTVLVSRILAWTLGRGWDMAQEGLPEAPPQSHTDSRSSDDLVAGRVMSGVVAITFTDAAAAQMASRVSESLAQIASKPAQAITGFDRELLAGQPDDTTLAQRALSLVGALDHLRVRTIHSYCWNLLTSYPISARVSPDLRIDADGRQLEEISRRVVGEAAKRGYAVASSHPVGRLALRQIDANRLSAAAVSLISEGVPAQALEQDPLSSELCGAFVHRLQSRLEAAAEVMAPFTGVARAKNAARIVRSLGQSIDRLTSVPAPADREALVALVNAFKDIWGDSLVSHLGKWSRSDLNKTESDLIGDQRQRLAEISSALAGSLRICQAIDVPLLEDARMALAPILRQVENELRARGLATYNALLSEAWALLAHHPDVRKRERARIDQLLVDEFQDTDRVQCALVRILGLDGDKQDNPGLFVVGDPKQSIYGWRNADLGAYDEFKSALKSAGGVFCHLERNFRSIPAVLEEVDRAIAPIMSEKPGLQPAFRSLVSAKALAAGQRAEESPAIEYWVSWQTEETDARPAKAKTLADDAAEIEASAIARDISKLYRRDGTSWNDFALLLRSTGRLEIFLEAFRRAGVPFAVTSDKHYYRRREIIDLAALVRSIINPVDHVALVTLLRSPAVGVPDAALLPLWQLNFPAHVTELKSPSSAPLDRLREVVFEVASSIPTEIPGIERVAGWEFSLMAALENLAVLRRSIHIDPADRFIELLRHRFLTDVTEAARYLGHYRLANLDSFFRRLERSLEEQSGDVQAVLRTLRRSVSEVEEAEQALPEGATDSGVQVMTIHKAKGLEFEHVYLAQLHARGRSSVTPSIQVDRRWLPGETPQFSLFGAPTLGFDEVLRRDREIDDSEQVRTLYVAMTRAKRRLVMIGNWPSEPTCAPRAGQISYVDLLSARENLPESFDLLFDGCKDDGRSYSDIGGVRWRFPQLAPATDSGTRSDRTLDPRISTPRSETQKEPLRILHQEAEARMKLPFAATASGEAAPHLAPLLRRAHDGSGESGHARAGRLVGTSFHKMLETWRFEAEPMDELERQRRIQTDWLSRNAPAAGRERALGQFEALLERFLEGMFWPMFTDSNLDMLARELPVLLPPGHSAQTPTGFVSGSIDLVVRDSTRDRFLIVDYKTDPIDNEEELRDRALAYSHQESLYAVALTESLRLQQPPVCQLWFIWPDRLWENPMADSQ